MNWGYYIDSKDRRGVHWYEFKSFKVYWAYRWYQLEQLNVNTDRYFANKEEIESYKKYKKNIPVILRIERSNPIFDYYCTCGRCWESGIPLSEKQREDKIQEYINSGWEIIE